MITETVYVQLLNEGTDVWRPVLGVPIGRGVYRLLPTPDYDPEDEEWEFPPDTLVECRERVLSGGRRLVAVRETG